MRFSLRTVEKAVLGELLAAFLIGLIAFNFILMMEKLLKLTRILSSVGASVWDVVSIILLIQPNLFIPTTPLALLIAVLMVYGRLNMDNELTAMRNAGMSFWQIAAPVRFLALACFLLAILFSFYVAPAGAVRLKETVSKIIAERAPYAVEEGAFNAAFPGMVIYVNSKPSSDAMEDIFIFDERHSPPRTLTAERGAIKGGDDKLDFRLDGGFLHMAGESLSTEVYFDRYDFSIPLEQREERKKTEFTPFELLKEAKTAGKRQSAFQLEFHRRLTFPLMCLLIPLLAPPLALLAGKAGRFGGLTIGFGVFTSYYIGLLYGERLVQAGTIPHYIGAWAPLTVFALASYLVFREAGKD